MLSIGLELGPEWRTVEHGGWTLHEDVPDGSATTFAASVVQGLSARPRTLDCRWLYDAEGSRLYEAITATEDYYPTRTEDQILARNASAICALVGGGAVVELGSGSSTKTRHLLDAWAAQGPVRYHPIDVSASALRGACADLAARYPGARIEGLATSYARGLAALGPVRPKTVVFLGSTLGNYDRAGTRAFLELVAGSLGPGDHLLLGIDRVKPADVLERAYDDSEGVTRRFILNLFGRMNRELGTSVPEDALRYESRWNPEAEQVEMRVVPTTDVPLTVEGRAIELPAGEPILVEISRKFRVSEVERVAAAVGLELRGQWSDEREWFTELLLRRA